MADTPFPSNGTDAEKRAWADKQTDPKAKPKAKAAPAAPAPESEAEKLAKQAKEFRYFQYTDDHQ